MGVLLFGQKGTSAQSKKHNSKKAHAVKSERSTTKGNPAQSLGVTTSLTCIKDGKVIRYDCYLPKGKSLIDVEDALLNIPPGGSAQPLSTRFGDRLGWAMLALKGVPSSDWAALEESAEAVMNDFRQRTQNHVKRWRFAGFSAGGFSAYNLASRHLDECMGVILIGSHNTLPLARHGIPIYYLVGATDFNRGKAEMRFADEKQRERPVALRVHSGGHSWGTQSERDEAVRWLASVPPPGVEEKLPPLPEEPINEANREEARAVYQRVHDKFSHANTLMVSANSYNLFSRDPEYVKAFSANLKVGTCFTERLFWKNDKIGRHEEIVYGITRTSIYDGKMFYMHPISGQKYNQFYQLIEEPRKIEDKMMGVSWALSMEAENVSYHMAWFPYRSVIPTPKRVAIITLQDPDDPKHRERTFFDPDTLLPIAFEYMGGGLVTRVQWYTKFTFDATLSPSLFRWAPPPGTKATLNDKED